jgi:subtilisin family serine protease
MSLPGRDGGSREADEYMKMLTNRHDLLLGGNKIETYESVRIAILDSGIDPAHPNYENIRGYKDFVSQTDEHIDKTGHGTNGVVVTFAVVPEAHVYVARVFEKEPTDSTTPSVVAQVRSTLSRFSEAPLG